MLEGSFKCVIAEIQKFEKAEIGQEFFDKVYGEGEVKSENEMRTRIREEIAKSSYERESEYRFMVDTRESLIKKGQD